MRGLVKLQRLVSDRGLRGTLPVVARVVRRRLVGHSDPLEARRRQLGQALHKQFGGVVQAGPFKGFRMNPEMRWGAGDRGSMIAGLYEQPVVEALAQLSRDRSVLVDVGAADGYYGVGAVASGLFARSVCFEADPTSRDEIAKVAKLNGIADKVTAFGRADSDLVNTVEQAGVSLSDAVILIDIEGGEFELLDDGTLRRLASARIIIELHDNAKSSGAMLRHTLIEAAMKYFSIAVIENGSRNPHACEALISLREHEKWLICSEARHVPQSWLVLTPLV